MSQTKRTADKPRVRGRRKRAVTRIEFEDRSNEEYQAKVSEVMGAIAWIRDQRAKGNLPN